MGIELSTEEVDSYMLNSPRGILCVSRPDSAPLALPMWFGWVERRIVMTTLATSKKVRSIRKSPRVSFLVESGDDYFSLKALMMIGDCELADDPGEVARWQEGILESKPVYKKLFPDILPPHLEAFYKLPRVALLIRPESITSWDFGKVRH